ncbi:MAG: hypothetical protein QOK35_2907, partial [Pseudonocardiales bacterium]|nr:hypothetical protein [Pseudonocardiales bacterium]
VLGATPASGVVVVRPVGDLTAAVRPYVRTWGRALLRVLLRVPAVTLRTCRPMAAGLVVALQKVPLVAAARAATQPFAARTPAVPPAVAVQFAPLCSHEVALPADPTAPRRARALLRTATQDWDLDEDLSHDAAMVVTELVANAVDHAGTTSTLRVDLDDRGLYVAVRDGCPDSALQPRAVDPTAPRGRGLQMIDALTASWGVITHADGKTVWAVLRPQRP